MALRLPPHPAALVLLATAAACSPYNNTGEGVDGPAESEAELVATMEVETSAERVQLMLHVTNSSGQPIELRFNSGQRFDFVVQRPGGDTVWRWSADRGFTQALGTETLGPGESLRYSAEWPIEERRGEYEAVGMVTANNRTVRESTRFTLE